MIVLFCTNDIHYETGMAWNKEKQLAESERMWEMNGEKKRRDASWWNSPFLANIPWLRATSERQNELQGNRKSLVQRDQQIDRENERAGKQMRVVDASLKKGRTTERWDDICYESRNAIWWIVVSVIVISVIVIISLWSTHSMRFALVLGMHTSPGHIMLIISSLFSIGRSICELLGMRTTACLYVCQILPVTCALNETHEQ